MSALPAALNELVSPVGGLVSSVTPLPRTPGHGDFTICSASLGDLSRVLPTVGAGDRGGMNGAGGATDPARAALLSVAEALERYSSCVFTEQQLIWETARGLGAAALDLETVPRCSAAELADPRCPVRAPDPGAPIRWVRGVSLMTRAPVWVPAIMTFLHIPYLAIGERFALPISTGCAAHTDLAAALLSGLCEVIERDAIALLWLQRMALPRLSLDGLGGALGEHLERAARGAGETAFFDATTDLGVPTIYSVDTMPGAREVATLVMCATDVDPHRAAAKILREAASSRIALEARRPVVEDPADCFSVFDGALHMARPERRHAFDFLLGSETSRRLPELPALATGDAASELRAVLGRLAARGLEAFAVDLTTDEALSVGFRVVRVIVPGLQPLSFAHRARFLAHPRLYDAPARMGFPVHAEEEITPWPQPFA